MSDLKIVQGIEETLDQLILNAETISNADMNELSDMELDAFQKTQESLLNNLLKMDTLHKTASFKLHEKRKRFEALKSNYTLKLENLDQRPIVCKRRAKRFFDLRGRRKLAYAPVSK